MTSGVLPPSDTILLTSNLKHFHCCFNIKLVKV
uniref:Uncharacterized protein n=1 Tax=Arundo donax TaxID=35708 RepID=A0A0A9B981_ARUDO